MPKVSIYQAKIIKDKSMLSNAPFFSRERDKNWISRGYYFYESHIDLCHSYASNRSRIGRKYQIIKGEIDISNRCFDLAGGNPEHEAIVNQAVDVFIKNGLDQKTFTFAKMINILFNQKMYSDCYDSIRVLFVNDLKIERQDSNIIKTQGQGYYIRKRPIQLCILNTNGLQNSQFDIVFKSKGL